MEPIFPNSVSVSTRRFSKVNLWHELFVAARFSCVGAVATAVHITVVWALLILCSITPILANSYAFLIAFGVSFLGNYIWTFRSPGSPHRVIVRFFLIAVTAFATNTLILAFLVNKGWFSPFFSAALSASIVPVISFAVSRFWCFKVRK